MFVMTLIRSRRPQVAAYKDFMELRQYQMRQLVPYRNLVAVSRPDQKRLALALREDRIGGTDRLAKELSRSDSDLLAD
jgi:hypothetical protein